MPTQEEIDRILGRKPVPNLREGYQRDVWTGERKTSRYERVSRPQPKRRAKPEAVAKLEQAERKSARQELERLTALILRPIGEGGISAEIALGAANGFYGKGLITAQELGHYRRLALKNQLSDGRREDQLYVLQLAEEGLVPPPVAAKALGIKPQEVSMRAAQPLSETEKAVEGILSAHREGKIGLGRAYAQVHELALTPWETQQANTILTLDAGLPANATPTARPIEASVLANLKYLGSRLLHVGGAVLALPEQLWLKSRAGPLTAEDVLDLSYTALRGGTREEMFTEKRIAALPKNASLMQMAVAMGTGMLEDSVNDPVFLASFLVGYTPVAGAKAASLMRAAAIRVGQQFGLEESVAARMGTFLAQRTAKMDVVAFGAGRSPGEIATVRRGLHNILRRNGVEKSIARKIEDAVIGRAQASVRKQWRIAGQPIYGNLVRRPAVRNIEDTIRANAVSRVERAISWVEKNVPAGELRPSPQYDPLGGALRAEAWEAGVHPQALAEIRLDRLVGERLRDLAEAEKTPLRSLGNHLKQFFTVRGTVPQEDMAALQVIVGKHTNQAHLFEAMLTQPVAKMAKGDRELVGRYLGWYPRKVTSPEFSELTGIAVGDIWQIPDAKRLELVLRATNEYTGEAQIEAALRGGKSAFLSRRVDLTLLPPKAQQILKTGDELAARYEWALGRMRQEGMDLGDKGVGYLTHLAPREGVARQLPGGDPWFAREATFEHPTLAEWMRAADPKAKNIPPFITDPLVLGRAYGRGMAWGTLLKDLTEYSATYGFPAKGIRPEAAELLGYTPILTKRAGIDLGAWEAVAKPHVVKALKEHLLPEGVSDYLGMQLTPDHPLLRTARHLMRAPRMSVLNSLSFLNAQVPDQMASMIISGFADTEKYLPGLRLALRAMSADVGDALSAVAPHGALQDLKCGLMRGGVGFIDIMDEKLFAPLRNNVIAASIGRAMGRRPTNPALSAAILRELTEGNILGQGYAMSLARHPEPLVGPLDKLLDNTIGWGVRIGGAFEDVSRGAHYAAKRLSGWSPTDTARSTFAGYPAYGREYQAPFLRYAGQVQYFLTYTAQRSTQVPAKILERPVFGYALYHYPQLWREAVLTPTQKQMFESSGNPQRMQPQYLPWRWDWWPYSNVPSSPTLDKIKEASIPTLAIRFPMLEILGDMSRLLGIGNPGATTAQAIGRAMHPWIRATGQLMRGDWEGAWKTASPLTQRVLKLGQVGKPVPAERIERLLRNAGLPSSQKEPPRPEDVEALKFLEDFSFATGQATGLLTRTVYLPRVLRDMSMPELDELNQLRRSEGKPPLPPQTRQANQLREAAQKAGVYPAPTLSQAREWVAQGHGLQEMLAIGQERWRRSLPRDTRVPAGTEREKRVDETAAWLAKVNERRAQWKLEPIEPWQMEILANRRVPTTTVALQRALRGDFPADPGYCSRWLQLNLSGTAGHGDANELGPWLETQGLHPTSDPPRVGDILISPEYGSDPAGHIGFVAKDPETGTLRLYSNYEGKVGFIDLRGGTVYRAPQTSVLDLVSRFPLPLPPMERPEFPRGGEAEVTVGGPR